MPTEDSSLTISAVERETGIGKDTLRVWERRYGFPAPLRNDAGERRYPDAQVRKLRIIRQLIDRGLRPAKLLQHSTDELLLQLKTSGDPQVRTSALPAELQEIMASVRSHSPDAIRRQLKLALLRVGVRKFLSEFVEPLNEAIGDAWASGELAIGEEHFYSEHIQIVLRHAIETIPEARPHPRILLTTLSGEEHQLGLLMAHAYLALEGAQCISLGIQTPIGEVQRATSAYAVNIVGLSFGQTSKERESRESLQILRSALAPDVQIWAGGKVWQRSPLDMPGILTISALTDIPMAVAAWRTRHPGSRSTRNPTVDHHSSSSSA